MPLLAIAAALGLLALFALTRSAEATAPGASIHPDVMSDVERWRAVVEREGVRVHTPPELVLAVIARESRGESTAIGSTGDYGLMQITRPAWQDYQVENNDPAANPFPDAMLDGAINIRVGSWYLNRKIEEMGNRFDGLRAYNCGTVGAKASPTCGATYAAWVVDVGLAAYRARA